VPLGWEPCFSTKVTLPVTDCDHVNELRMVATEYMLTWAVMRGTQRPPMSNEYSPAETPVRKSHS
jgi:hypothetical protein